MSKITKLESNVSELNHAVKLKEDEIMEKVQQKQVEVDQISNTVSQLQERNDKLQTQLNEKHSEIEAIKLS